MISQIGDKNLTREWAIRQANGWAGHELYYDEAKEEAYVVHTVKGNKMDMAKQHMERFKALGNRTEMKPASKLTFYADTAGRYTLSFVWAGQPSNQVVIDVTGTYPLAQEELAWRLGAYAFLNTP